VRRGASLLQSHSAIYKVLLLKLTGVKRGGDMMAKNPSELIDEVIGGMTSIGEEDSERMQAFLGLMKAVKKPGSLDKKTKELISLAISLYARCEHCIADHTREAFKAGASRQDVVETAFITSFMGGGPVMAFFSTVLWDSINAFAPDSGK